MWSSENTVGSPSCILLAGLYYSRLTFSTCPISLLIFGLDSFLGRFIFLIYVDFVVSSVNLSYA